MVLPAERSSMMRTCRLALTSCLFTLAVAGLGAACSASGPTRGTAPDARQGQPLAEVARPAFPASQRATLTFEGPIDGSDRILITRAGARWENVHWGAPQGVVRLNGIAWEPRMRPVLTNDGETRFLPDSVDLYRARLVSRSGRDFAGIEPGPDGLVLRFVDSPNGPAPYTLIIAFE
jgi:hypothetical protein